MDVQFAPDLSVTIYDECVAALVLDYSFRQHLYCTIRTCIALFALVLHSSSLDYLSFDAQDR